MRQTDEALGKKHSFSLDVDDFDVMSKLFGNEVTISALYEAGFERCTISLADWVAGSRSEIEDSPFSLPLCNLKLIQEQWSDTKSSKNTRMIN